MVEPVPGRRPDPVPFQQEARRPEPRRQEAIPPPPPEPRLEPARAEAARAEARAADPNRAENAPPPPPQRFGGADDRGLFVDLFA